MPMWILAAVRLRLGKAPPNDGPIVQPTAKPRADKCLRRRHRVNRIVLCRQSSHMVLDRIYGFILDKIYRMDLQD